MVLPTIALMADAGLANVPQQYLRGAAALGPPRWATIRDVAFPAAKSSLFTGVILETGRAIGETMAILMVSGNVVQTSSSLFDPIRTLTANIALEMAYALGEHRALFWVQNGAGRLIETGIAKQIFEEPCDPLAAAYVNGMRGE